MNEDYKTKEGFEVRIYSRDNAHGYIHGAIMFNGGWHLQQWSEDGSALFENSEPMSDKLDLVKTPKTRYVVTYPDDFIDAEAVFTTRREAELFGREIGYHTITQYSEEA